MKNKQWYICNATVNTPSILFVFSSKPHCGSHIIIYTLSIVKPTIKELIQVCNLNHLALFPVNKNKNKSKTPHIIKVKNTNVAIIMVEQNAKQALSISDRGYVLVTGQNKFEGSGNQLLQDPEVRRSFLGA